MMKRIIMLLVIFTVSICFTSCMRFGFGKLSPLKQKKILTELCNELETSYVFRDVADSMTSYLMNNFENGDYSSLVKPKDFAKQIERDMLRSSKDTHIWFIFSPGYVMTIQKRDAQEAKTGAACTSSDLERFKKINYGFEKVEILENNIGYIDISSFIDTSFGDAKSVASESMDKISKTDAIIIDVRSNRGGYGTMVDYICSHFFEEPVLLSTVHYRKKDSTAENWSYKVGKPAFKQPLYILTSDETYSAAEALAYTMKHHKRATIVGKSTAGGAHSCHRIVIWDYFAMQLPVIRSIHPNTGRDWERTGVKPDIEIEPANALDKTIELAMSKNSTIQ